MNATEKWNWKRKATLGVVALGLITIVAASRSVAERSPDLGRGKGSAPVAASPETASGDLPIFSIRPAETRVSFTVAKLGVFKVEGRFRDVQGKVAYDPKRPAESRVGVRIQVASLDTSEPGRDETLRSSDFFDAGRFPEIAFQSRRVEPGPDGTLRLLGDLTIRGVTKSVEMPVRILGLSPNPGGKALAGFEAELTIDRRDFGVLGTRWSGGRALIGNEVAIHIVVGAEERS